jgi:antitoxin (DNA-binding transcriptional repressor) of toxin-antitoxin stability system
MSGMPDSIGPFVECSLFIEGPLGMGNSDIHRLLSEVAAMPVVVTLEEMEGNLRKLLHAVRDGKHVVVTEKNIPIALLNPWPPKSKREFGALKGQFAIGTEFFDPLSAEELAAWE